jgi:hypothetical protein
VGRSPEEHQNEQSQPTDPIPRVTAAQPTRGGTAPAAPPITMFDLFDRLSQNVYTNT